MQGDAPSPPSVAPVPWLIWIVVAFLALNGIVSAVEMFTTPMAAVWLAASALFAIGFFRRWRLIYVSFIVACAILIVRLGPSDPFSGLMGLVLLLLVASQYRWFFPTRSASTMVASKQVV